MSLLAHRPRFSAADATAVARDRWGIDGEVDELVSERDRNFLVRTAQGAAFVLKISNALEDRAFLEGQHAVLRRVAATGICPRVVPDPHGCDVAVARGSDGTEYLARVLTFLPGRVMADLRHRPPELLEDLGRGLGRVDRALSGFDHPALERVFPWDLARGLDVVGERLRLVADGTMSALVRRAAERVDRALAPLVPRLRRSVVHNDANDHNLLVDDDGPRWRAGRRLTGLIDFGDLVRSFVVADPAVAVAYAVLDAESPLDVAAGIVRGYHAEHPLDEAEIAALFPLVCLRLAVSVCMAAEQMRERPGDEYLAVSQEPIRRTLPRLLDTPAAFAEAVLRGACGLEPAPTRRAVVSWLDAHHAGFASPLDVSLRDEPCLVFDLGVSSPIVPGDVGAASEAAMTARLFGLMRHFDVGVGVGRYDEARLLYWSPAFAGGDGTERRTIHLGIDLFAPPGTTVRAPIPGVVHAVAHNRAPLDYGPVVILEHRTDAGVSFYTLYGHLSRESIATLSAGRALVAGEAFAAIGDAGENGGWTPHLHLQLLTDLLGLGCDVPGVARPTDRHVWKSLSPDPNLVLRIPASAFPPDDPEPAETLATRRAVLGRNLSVAYRAPVKIVRGWKQHLWDESGRRFLDAYNNVPHVGHCHPRVVSAGQAQMAILNTNTRYLHDLVNRLAERLTATLPDPLRVCYFVNSASEANELALRIARAYTGGRDLVVLDAAYHGHTTTLIDVSPYKHAGPGGTGAPDWVHAVAIPDDYRGPYRRGEPDVGLRYARDVAATIDGVRASGRRLCGFIAETCPSVGGQVFLPDRYLAEVYRAVRAAGGVTIADEVQTGYGRIGSHFWAFEAHGVVPDIVVAGKPMGNGHPIAAVVTTPELAAAFDNGMEFFSTFGGNPVSAAIGLAVLDVLEDEQLQLNAFEAGDRMLRGLRALGQRFEIVGDVRGAGFFLGVELVNDRVTREPAGDAAAFVSNRFRELGILLGTDGPFHNVVKIRPPMPFSVDDGAHLVRTFERILTESF